MTKNIILFKFYKESNVIKKNNFLNELFTNEHIEEIRQRLTQSIFSIFLFILFSFIKMKSIVKVLEIPVGNIHFFQNSPGEYFLLTLKISIYTGLIFSIPILLTQIIFFLLPGLRNQEKNFVVGLILGSFSLFSFGLIFSYFILIPAALKFFINYSIDVIEPLWSFDQYFNFMLILFLSTGFIFQIPIFQIILSFSRIISGIEMLNLWKYILLVSTIFGAILTPSADPLTQILLSGAVFFLYITGSFLVIFLQKTN
jgi:sec-independent protein translocase protein TatC|uniref:Photosystem assembly protein Ycf3 n=1 Tax=Vaucheria litorea TaxID=109269 RepID=B7T1R2_VAULI|nr:Sec-independent translocase component C [Vaucheria litorea]ACF70878.1 photosystem assembly protein Ycf3 [Vaucheria litorea]